MASIFVTRKISEVGITVLRDAGHEARVYPEDHIIGREELLLGVKGVDAILCMLTEKIDAEVLDAAGPQLKIVANYAVGYDNIDLETTKSRGVVVTNTPGVLTDTVAEHTFALMLAISHRIVEADSYFRAGKYKGWEPMLLLGNDLSGKTLGVIGLGRIGSLVASHGFKGFGMKVVYHDLKPNADFEKEYEAEYKEKIEDLLAEADYVSLHVPLTGETRHLINAQRLRQMKKTAYLINTSRGLIVDEKALVEALRSGVVRGAALDVFENEPVSAQGLIELNNVVLTPHLASATEETRSKMAVVAAENIVAVLGGGKAPNVVS